MLSSIHYYLYVFILYCQKDAKTHVTKVCKKEYQNFTKLEIIQSPLWNKKSVYLEYIKTNISAILPVTGNKNKTKLFYKKIAKLLAVKKYPMKSDSELNYE